MTKKYKFCQSCGMPMSKDKEGGGTETDGSKSAMYCSYCYQNGAFTVANCTADEMRNYCVDLMVKKLKYPRFLAKIFTMNIPKLERWKK